MISAIEIFKRSSLKLGLGLLKYKVSSLYIENFTALFIRENFKLQTKLVILFVYPYFKHNDICMKGQFHHISEDSFSNRLILTKFL